MFILSTIVRSVVAIAGVLIVQLVVAGSSYGATGNEAVSANQPEYTMGDTAVLYGVGFDPSITVIVQIIRADGSIVTGAGTEMPGSDTVVTNAAGAFTYQYIVDGGPVTAYDGVMTVNVRPASNPSTVLATTTFIDGPEYILQGCSKDRGDCNYDSGSSWAGGSAPMTGWSASSLKGWFESEDIAFRLRIGLRNSSSSGAHYYLTQHDNSDSGQTAIESGSGFYVGAGPSVPGFVEGTRTKICTTQSTGRLAGQAPTPGAPCIVTGPFFSGVDDDADGSVDEDPVDGLDNDGDGRYDEDPPPYGPASTARKIQYTWGVHFNSVEVGDRDDRWALYWKGHAGSGSSSYPGSWHNHTNANGWQDVEIDRCEGSGSGVDMSITKSDSPDPITVGQNLTYTLTVRNNSSSNSASGVKAIDTLPGTVTFVSATWGTGPLPATQNPCSMSGGTVECNIGTMTPNTTRTVTIVVTPQVGAVGTLSNTAIVTRTTGSDPVPGNNSATTTTTVNALSADLSITKTVSPTGSVVIGAPLQYAISVFNAGPNSANGITVTDTLPAGVAFVSASASPGPCTTNTVSGITTVTCNLGNGLGALASRSATINVTTTAVGTWSNTASVSATTSDPNLSNNTSPPATTTVNGSADLSITKSESADPVLVGQNLTYTITVTNNGPTSASNVAVTDALPGGVTLVSATASQGSCSGTSTVTCNLGTVPFPGSATVTITIRPTAAGTLSNSASVSSSTNDPNSGNNTAGPVTTTVNAASANLSITKTDAPDPVTAGNQLTYNISVSNLGPSTATNVTVTDTLPGNVTWFSSTPSQGTCSGTSTVSCNLGSLPSPGSATVTIVVTTTVAGSLSNTATVSSTTNDPTPGNNSSTTTTTVNPPSSTTADLGITKVSSPNPLTQVGSNVTYTVTVHNYGPGSATGVVMLDFMPTAVNWLSSTPSQGTCQNPLPNGQIQCNLGTLANGVTATIVIVAQTIQAGNVGNSASVSADQVDPNPNNNDTGMVVTNVGDVARLINISTRGFVQTGDNVMIGGFVVGGNLPKALLVRARGRSLSAFGIAGTMADPTIELYSGATLIAQNNNWQTTDPLCLSPAVSCGNATDIQNTGKSPCAVTGLSCGLDSAIYVTLPPGPYTVILRGVGGGTGVGIVEVIDTDGTTLPKLVNISTRGLVQTGDSIMIGGFVIGAGSAPKTILIRVRGRSLANLGVLGTIANPYVELYSGATKIAQNDNWQTTDPLCLSPAVSCGNASDIQNTGRDPCSVTTTACTLDSSILITLPPGPYTAQVRGVANGTGVAIVEVLDLSP